MHCGALGIEKQQGLQSLIAHPRSAGDQEGKICLVADLSGLCCSCEDGFTLWRLSFTSEDAKCGNGDQILAASLAQPRAAQSPLATPRSSRRHRSARGRKSHQECCQ